MQNTTNTNISLQKSTVILNVNVINLDLEEPLGKPTSSKLFSRCDMRKTFITTLRI